MVRWVGRWVSGWLSRWMGYWWVGGEYLGGLMVGRWWVDGLVDKRMGEMGKWSIDRMINHFQYEIGARCTSPRTLEALGRHRMRIRTLILALTRKIISRICWEEKNTRNEMKWMIESENKRNEKAEFRQRNKPLMMRWLLQNFDLKPDANPVTPDIH